MSSPSSINNNSQIKCKLLDWYDSREIVAEGRWSSNDPAALVHHVPLCPYAIRVWAGVAKKQDVYLWRPTSEMTCIEEGLGSTVSWPSDKVTIVEAVWTLEHGRRLQRASIRGKKNSGSLREKQS
ncbi:uncharacterized protein E5676_scaffold552G00570 [Cucumis melo var. makuwa]|uniref:Transposase Tnp1/En/Spm-like domain-containing protein n=1 Tax=Cucumis melo var. makuwa TaxID=1194695 RepID=A0A5A7ULQ4_CUCMM|nr:uncharacterized protein E6C27_scaffold24G002440 [Cucumis melo var. makuwa]TYK14568.1 uncharacterized protein E5676_scaffold552G00570 [Cucumis melo var. makuwa]